MAGIVKRFAVVVLAVVLVVVAWLLWGSGGGPSVDDLAGVYRFDSHPEFEAIEVGPDDERAVWLQLFQLGLKTSTLTLKRDGSLTWTMSGWGLERGRWEVEGDRVFIFMKREGRREWPPLHDGLLVRDGTLVVGRGDKPPVLRKQ